jgi:hypothetical protein
MRPRGLQQHEGADDVALNEVAGSVDGPVDVAFGGQVHHRIGVVRGEGGGHRARIRDVCPHQYVAGMLAGFLERVLGRGVGHLVDVDNDMVGVAQHVADHGGTDKPASTGQQNLHRQVDPVS